MICHQEPVSPLTHIVPPLSNATEAIRSWQQVPEQPIAAIRVLTGSINVSVVRRRNVLPPTEELQPLVRDTNALDAGGRHLPQAVIRVRKACRRLHTLLLREPMNEQTRLEDLMPASRAAED